MRNRRRQKPFQWFCSFRFLPIKTVRTCQNVAKVISFCKVHQISISGSGSDASRAAPSRGDSRKFLPGPWIRSGCGALPGDSHSLARCQPHGVAAGWNFLRREPAEGFPAPPGSPGGTPRARLRQTFILARIAPLTIISRCIGLAAGPAWFQAAPQGVAFVSAEAEPGGPCEVAPSGGQDALTGSEQPQASGRWCVRRCACGCGGAARRIQEPKHGMAKAFLHAMGTGGPGDFRGLFLAMAPARQGVERAGAAHGRAERGLTRDHPAQGLRPRCCNGRQKGQAGYGQRGRFYEGLQTLGPEIPDWPPGGIRAASREAACRR
jgi:hypothetical protein